METGKALRLRRFTKKGGTVIVPLDHSLFAESPAPLADLKKLVKTIAETDADGILVTPGMLPHIASAAGNLAIILRIDGTHTRLGKHLERIDLITSVESAVSLGVDMVVVNVFVGTDNEDAQLVKLGKVATDCRKYGMPLLGEMMPVSILNFHYGKGEKASSPEEISKDIALVSRLGAEIGADCIKTQYSGDKDGFKKAVESTPVPIWIAGGPKKGGDEQFLKMIEESVKAGARGAVIGRNAWDRENPKEMINALCGIVHS